MYSHQPLLITKKSHPPDVLEEIWGSGVGRRGVTQHVYQNCGLNGGFENTIGEILKEVFYYALSVFGVKPLNFFFQGSIDDQGDDISLWNIICSSSVASGNILW